MEFSATPSLSSLLLTLARVVDEFLEHEDGEGEVVKAGRPVAGLGRDDFYPPGQWPVSRDRRHPLSLQPTRSS